MGRDNSLLLLHPSRKCPSSDLQVATLSWKSEKVRTHRQNGACIATLLRLVGFCPNDAGIPGYRCLLLNDGRQAEDHGGVSPRQQADAPHPCHHVIYGVLCFIANSHRVPGRNLRLRFPVLHRCLWPHPW